MFGVTNFLGCIVKWNANSHKIRDRGGERWESKQKKQLKKKNQLAKEQYQIFLEKYCHKMV